MMGYGRKDLWDDEHNDDEWWFNMKVKALEPDLFAQMRKWERLREYKTKAWQQKISEYNPQKNDQGVISFTYVIHLLVLHCRRSPKLTACEVVIVPNNFFNDPQMVHKHYSDVLLNE